MSPQYKSILLSATALTATLSLVLSFVLAFLTAPLPLSEPTSVTPIASPTFNEQANTFLSRYCMKCHLGENAEGGIDLETLITDSVSDQTELWTQVFAVVEDEYMPPEDHPRRPRSDELEQLKQSWLAVLAEDDSGNAQTSIRRLNRTEYENTVRDLFQLTPHPFAKAQQLVLNDQYFQPASEKMPEYVMAFSYFQWHHRKPTDFPDVPAVPDDPPVEHGFDNNNQGISFSPLQMEAWLQIASKLLNSPEFRAATPLWSTIFQSDSTQLDDQLKDAESVLNEFLPRAFRRSVSDQDLRRWLALFESELQRTQSFTTAMKSTVTGILVSPNFLFRNDALQDRANPDCFDVANRLSYLLWCSMPDEELFRAAEMGLLNNPLHVRSQIRRMLRDRRCKALSNSFGIQWLKTLKAINAKPEQRLFSHYYENLGQSPPAVSMAIEQMLLFEMIMIENRSILEFIDTDFGYVNRLLMDWYGLDPVESIGFAPDREDLEDFFRVKWPNKKRGGIISSGATLIATSAAHRTSPVYRGAWLLEVIFNRPPPPPPADIPPLETDPDDLRPADFRERLKMHRQDPNCASCHNKIDPIGFALEEFDPVGQLRTTYRNKTPIDSRGELNGRTVEGIIGLKQEVLNQKDRFVRAFIEHLLEYTLGRDLDIRDDAMVEQIFQVAANNDFRFATIVEEIALHTSLGHPALDPRSRFTDRGQNRK